MEDKVGERITKVREFIERGKIDAIITKNSSHIFYLTGILEIEGYLIIDKKSLYIFTPELYFYECSDFFKNNKNIFVKKIKNKTLQKFLSRYRKTGFINTEISYSNLKNFKKETKTKLFPFEDFILEMRMVKDKEEIEYIKKAKEIAEKTAEKIKDKIKEGTKELDIVAEIKYLIIKNGGRKESFEPIVASGIFSSYPHHKPKNKKIEKGDVVVVDLGADYNGYKSDLTYTFFAGKVSDEVKKIYRIVEETKKICIEYSQKENLKGDCLYKKAVENFRKYNLEKFFIHGLGHGVGINIHEKPSLSKKSKDFIKRGSVFTIEPGIYLPGKFGIRLEEMIFKT